MPAPRRFQFSIRSLLLLIAALSAPLAVLAWYQSPAQKTRRLLAELAHRPGGHIDLAWSGRDPADVDADFRKLGRAAVPALIAALHDESSTIRYLAAGQLGNFKDDRAVEPLIASLRNDPDAIVRRWAASALGDIGDQRASAALRQCLQQPDVSLRWQSIEALGKLKDKSALGPITASLTDTDIYVRAHAAEALGRLHDPGSVAPLLRVLQADPDCWVRREAAWSLGQIGDPRAVPGLTTALQDESSDVAAVGKDALDRVNGLTTAAGNK
jgi:HEAT repeat protein